MKFNDIFKQAFKNFISNKKNIIILLLIALSCSMVLFTVSFNQSVSNYWENSVKKLVDYRTFFTYYDFNKYEENEAVEKLEKHTNIEDVAPYSSYLITMTANDYIDENKNSVFFLEGTISNPINIIAGERLEDYGNGEKVMICADNFYPYQNESVYDYSRDDLKDFTKRIGEKIPISFIDSEKVEYFKLVGVYDAESNQTNGNLCYTSFQTITSLNLYYQSEVYNQEDVYLPLIMVIDDVDNIDQTLSEIQKDGFFTSGSVLAINTDVGDKIMNITFIIAVIMSILSLILLLILSLKNQEIRKKEFGIYK